jgi:hypothetical protein
MNKKEYNAWLNKLAQTEDADMLDIVAKAKQASWQIGDICTDKAEVMDAMCIEDETEWNRNIKDGWISVHGKYIVTWYDGI